MKRVDRPAGAPFWMVTFVEGGDAAACCANLAAVGGAPARAVPAKLAGAEMAAWRAAVAASVASAARA